MQSGGAAWTVFAHNHALAEQAWAPAATAARTQRATDDGVALATYQTTVDGLKVTAQTSIQASNSIAKAAERLAGETRDTDWAIAGEVYAMAEIIAAKAYLDAVAQHQYDYQVVESGANKKLALGYDDAGNAYTQQDFDSEVGAAKENEKTQIGQADQTYSIAYAAALGTYDSDLAAADKLFADTLAAAAVTHVDNLTQAEEDLDTGEALARETYEDQLAANKEVYLNTMASSYAAQLATSFGATPSVREQLAIDLALANQTYTSTVSAAGELYSQGTADADRQLVADASGYSRTLQVGLSTNQQTAAGSRGTAEEARALAGGQALNDLAASGNYSPTQRPSSPNPGAVYLPKLGERAHDDWFRTMPGSGDELNQMFSDAVYDAENDTGNLDEEYDAGGRETDRQLTGGLVRQRNENSELVVNSTEAEKDPDQDDQDVNQVEQDDTDTGTKEAPVPVNEAGDLGDVGDVVGDSALLKHLSKAFTKIGLGILNTKFGPVVTKAATGLLGFSLYQDGDQDEEDIEEVDEDELFDLPDGKYRLPNGIIVQKADDLFGIELDKHAKIKKLNDSEQLRALIYLLYISDDLSEYLPEELNALIEAGLNLNPEVTAFLRHEDLTIDIQLEGPRPRWVTYTSPFGGLLNYWLFYYPEPSATVEGGTLVITVPSNWTPDRIIQYLFQDVFYGGTSQLSIKFLWGNYINSMGRRNEAAALASLRQGLDQAAESAAEKAQQIFETSTSVFPGSEALWGIHEWSEGNYGKALTHFIIQGVIILSSGTAAVVVNKMDDIARIKSTWGTAFFKNLYSKVDGFKGAQPWRGGRPGHPFAHYNAKGISQDQARQEILDTLNNWHRAYAGVNPTTQRPVDVYFRNGHVVITESGNKTRVITSYWSKDKWATDRNYWNSVGGYVVLWESIE